MLCSLCDAIFRAPIEFKFRLYKKFVDLHRESAALENCYMCDCIWRSFIGDDENVEATDAADYFTTYRFIDQSRMHGHTGLLALVSDYDYPAFYVEPVADGYHVPEVTRDRSTTNTDSEESWTLIKQWLGQCINGHVKCNEHVSRINARLPARLLDLSNNQLRLILTNETTPDGPYASLSHCWGSGQYFKLTTATVDQMKAGFSKTLLSRTFNDAIRATLELGLKYLWIDALCIVQDFKSDWSREALAMADVYQGALCNLAATGSADGHGGLFHDRNANMVSRCIVETDWPESSVQKLRKQPDWGKSRKRLYEVRCDGFWRMELERAPLLQRAWVLQERLLAPRVIHFGARQVLWECLEVEACQTYPDGLPFEYGPRRFKGLDPSVDGQRIRRNVGPTHIDTNRFDAYYLWDNIIESYSEGALSHEEDKLIALSGVAKYMETILHDRYLAGLWQQCLPSQLLWRYDSPGTRPHKYRAPSWSWASVNPQTDRGLTAGRCYDMGILAKVIEVKIESPGQDTTGQVTGGHLRLRGPLCTAQFLPRKETDISRLSRVGVRMGGLERSGVVYEDVLGELQASEETTGGHRYHFFVIELQLGNPNTLVGLMLQPTGIRNGQFRRCGIVHMSLTEIETTVPDMEQEPWLQYEESHGGNTYTITVI
ncbi:hypothetical protein HO173_008561 [Letharia columbiana]|uniref:Heterokaryon incompatibility domain-containing protein n=1 Tax=Letharia columbiana TaxID=112416 RepID=A0A8H6FRA3_9LECA|nr:uncharacterized protein HO173_008561 [Letharia columbiana]KAF6233270.1 hypothetical protein HO173_008561 [Letharia columbiana]